MSTFKEGESQREIIIVRRGGNADEDGHHGGVWKIAFADFMTAMMCFFLVMWLVNAANEQTRVAVASYFNPVKLVDRNINRKGIDTSGKGDQNANNPQETTDQTEDRPIGTRRNLSGPADHRDSTEQSDTQRHSDRNLFADPYAVLAEIAQDTAILQNVSSRGDGGAQSAGPGTGAHGGEMYRDPFAPDFWSQQVAEPDIAAPQVTIEEANSDLEGPAAESDVAVVDPAAGTGLHSLKQAAAAAEPLPERFSEVAQPVVLAEQPEEDRAEPEKLGGPRTEELAEELRRELSEAFGRDDELNRTISVTTRPSGVLISLTDELNYGMFDVGSAVPHRELVLAMEKVAKALAARQGPVSIMGHTDGRPFRSAEYDNWRLSSARAHSAYYMLVRAGLAETRVHEISGLADRNLKVPDEPYADANRRIEIFLQVAE